MRENLILKKFKKEKVNGTFNLLEEETFFSSKIMEIEDEIYINNNSIRYYQYFYDVTDPNDENQLNLAKNNGYQYNELNEFLETFFLLDLVDLKNKNHKIYKQQQTEFDEKNNTKWIIKIDIRNILIEYLFAKIKERRTFKSVKYFNLLNKDINNSIYEYIKLNLLDRYKFNKIDFYVKYIDIKNNDIYSNFTIKQYDPIFRSDIELEENKETNINVKINNFTDLIAPLTIFYYQKKPSEEYKFDYYFNIQFVKI